MLKETGRVVAIETDALWVETIQKTTCGSCVAQKGCGTGLLAKLGVKPVYLRVLLQPNESSSAYRVNDSVTIGIPDDVVVKGSLFVYLVPVILMIVFSGIAHTTVNNELIVIVLGIIGLFLGSLLVRWHANVYRTDPRMQPQSINKDLMGEDPQVIIVNDDN